MPRHQASSNLHHYIPPLLRTLSPNALYYRRIAKQKYNKSRIDKGKYIPKRTQVTLYLALLQSYSIVSFHHLQLRSNLPTSSNQVSRKPEIITVAVITVVVVIAVTAEIVTVVVVVVKKAESQYSRVKRNSHQQNTLQQNSVTVSRQQDIQQQNF